MAPARPGEVRNPAGKPSKRLLLAREIAERCGLEAILELALQTKHRKAELAEALLAVAEHGEGQFGTGKANAQRLVHDLLGSLVKRAQVQHEHSLNVEVHRVKVREMLDEEPEERELEQANGHEEAEGPARPAK